jgi:hypothetical protein
MAIAALRCGADPQKPQPPRTPVPIIAQPPRVMLPCTVIRVHDADSFVATITFPFVDGLQLDCRMVRLQGADAWEVDQSRAGTVGKISDAEIRKGLIARDAVIELLKSTAAVYLEPRRKGDIDEPHGRVSAHVWLWFKDGRLLELADWIKANGHERKEPQ